jgi:hypothetical protein
MSKLFVQILLAIAEQDGYQVNLDESQQGIYLLQKNEKLLSVRLANGDITIHTTSSHEHELDRLVSRVETQIIQSVGEIKAR